MVESVWRELRLEGEIWIMVFDRRRIGIIEIGLNMIWIEWEERIV